MKWLARICFVLILTSAFSSITISCKKDPKETDDSIPDGKFRIEFNGIANGRYLYMHPDSVYLTSSGEPFTVSTLNYFITNIKFYAMDSSVFSEPESYHLIKNDVPSTKVFYINNIPDRSFYKMTFMIGVDSARNVSGAQTGALDPSGQASGMFWSWNTGYIQAKLEGTSHASTSPGNAIAYHIGGFKGAYSALRTITVAFPTNANVSKTHTPQIRLNTEVSKWFSGHAAISIAVNSNVTNVGQVSKDIADNYAHMFSIGNYVP